MVSQHVKTLLQGLQCPYPAPEEPGFSLAYRQLVAWLEHQKIRQLAPEDRDHLSSLEAQQWPVTFSEYLVELDCPGYESQATVDAESALQWLLHLATSLSYQDNETLMQPSSAQLQPAENKEMQPVLQQMGSPAFAQQLATLRSRLQMSSTGGSQVDDLRAARDIIAEQILPSAESSQVGQRSREAAQQLSTLDPDTFPLGFATGDIQVDLAATIMRMLYIKDLRQLQTVIDETLVQVQEYTANPKTDSSLGRLGR